MLDSDDRKIAKIFKSRLIQAGISIRKVIVYGSRARGKCAPESDLDIRLVIDTLDDDIERTISRIAWEVGFQFNRIRARTRKKNPENGFFLSCRFEKLFEAVATMRRAFS